MERFLETLLENFQEALPSVADVTPTLESCGDGTIGYIGSVGPPHQASSRTLSERPDWIQSFQEFSHDQPDPSVPILSPRRYRCLDKICDRLGAFASLAHLRLCLEAWFDRDGRRALGRR